jgi:hypothetical protein
LVGVKPPSDEVKHLAPGQSGNMAVSIGQFIVPAATHGGKPDLGSVGQGIPRRRASNSAATTTASDLISKPNIQVL